jgi:hypothetical protein
MTEQEVADHMAKVRGEKVSPHEADPGPESDLQGKITKWAHDRGYPCLSFRQSRKAQGFLVPGWPDITLVMPSRVLFIELKSANGWLRKEQRDIARMLLWLDAEWYQVKSWRRFMEAVNKKREIPTTGEEG